MNARQPLTKIELIQGSIRCFVLGLIGLVPLFGIPAAIWAVCQYHRVKRRQGDQWNPAQRYLIWGQVCAFLGVTLLLLLVAFVVVPIFLKAYLNGD